MGLEHRKDLLRELEDAMSCRVLAVVTGDRQRLETRIAPDLITLTSDHLARMGNIDRLAIFLYTPGGDSIAGWNFVNLVRQYCKELLVIVPFRALSTGTLIALGADQLYMGRHGVLSPVDPSVNSPFNPTFGGGQGEATQLLPVSVEDMVGFLDLARNEVRIETEAGRVEILKLLAEKVHPLALGAVYRAREQGADLTRRVLAKHMTDDTHKDQIERIVTHLTRELPTHSYTMDRDEVAQELVGLPLCDLGAKDEELVWSLYKEYEQWLKMTQPFSPELDLPAKDSQARLIYERASIESLENSTLHQHVYIADKLLVRTTVTAPGNSSPIQQVAERNLYEGWVTYKDGKAIT